MKEKSLVNKFPKGFSILLFIILFDVTLFISKKEWFEETARLILSIFISIVSLLIIELQLIQNQKRIFPFWLIQIAIIIIPAFAIPGYLLYQNIFAVADYLELCATFLGIITFFIFLYFSDPQDKQLPQPQLEDSSTKSTFKVKAKRIKLSKNNYPGAEIVHSACLEDYHRLLSTYDRLYDKVNIALAFCGAIFLVILSKFDYTQIPQIFNAQSQREVFFSILSLVFPTISGICIITAIIKLFNLLHSQSVPVLDSIACRNEEIYKFTPENATLWIIDKYTIAANEIKQINERKHKKYNNVVFLIIVSLLAFIPTLIINKG